MKFRISIWAVAILCCFALGIRQQENLALIWREYVSLGRDFEYDGSLLSLRKTLIRDIAARSDPEAAAIAEGRLRGYMDDEPFDALAQNVISFPDNEYFLFGLAYRLPGYSESLDPGIKLLLAEKLIKLDPDNANYHYLKAYALFNNRDGNDIDAALEELDYANKCSIRAPLYEKYKKRTINIANKARLSSVLTAQLSWSQQQNPFAYRIRRDLIRHAHLAFTNGNYTSGRRISNSLYGMMKREIRDGRMTGWKNPRMFGSIPYFGLWELPQQLELQRARLSDEEARQNRLELCALAAGAQKARSDREQRKTQTQNEYMRMVLVVPPAVHCGKMVISLALAWLILSVISLIRGFGQKSKVGFGGIILFLCGCLSYFFIVEFGALSRIFGLHCHYSYMEAFRPMLRPDDIIDQVDSALLFFGGPIVTLLALWGLGFIKPAKGAFWRLWNRRFLIAVLIGEVLIVVLWSSSVIGHLTPWTIQLLIFSVSSFAVYMVIMFGWWLFKCRFVWLLAIAIPLGFLTFLTSGYTFIRYAPMILFAIIGALVAANKPSNLKHIIKALAAFFSKKPEFVGIRRNCIHLTGIFIVVYWILFISLSPQLARNIKSYAKGYDRYKYKASLPEANEATYQQVLSWFDKKDLDKNEVPGLISLVMPEDLPGVLERLKEREFAKPSHMDRYYGPVASKRSKLKQANKLNDSDLIAAMTYCGRDVVSIIVDFMDNPQTERALVTRARLGDMTVKEKLEAIWHERMRNWVGREEEYDYIKRKIEESGDWPHWKNVVFANDIVGALACISAPDEAAGRFLDFIEKQEVSDLVQNYLMFESVRLLPTAQAIKVVKTYITKASSVKDKGRDGPHDDGVRQVLGPLSRLDGMCADRQIVEDVLKIMLLTTDARDNFRASEMPPYFTIESADLLKRGLASNNEDMRAWCVWQLRRVGHRWNKEQIDSLLTDKSWKVRANAMLAADGQVAEDEPSNFVRLVGTLAGQPSIQDYNGRN